MHLERCLMVTISMALLAVATPACGGAGTITAEPNPCRIEAGRIHCTTYLSWATEGVRDARVYVKREGRERSPEKEFATRCRCLSRAQALSHRIAPIRSDRVPPGCPMGFINGLALA
jgi:hypothetical protein